MKRTVESRHSAERVKLPLERVVQVGSALLVAGLIVSGVAALRGTTVTNERARWVAHTIEVRQQLNAASALASDAESGALGFAFTGDTSYLRLYRSNSSAAPAAVERVGAMTADNAYQQVRADSLAADVDRQLQLAQRMVALRRTGGSPSAVVGVARDEGLSMDLIRARVAEMQAEEARLLSVRTRLLAFATRRAVIALWSGLLLALVTVSIASTLIVVQLRRRRRAEVDLSAHYSKLTELANLVDHAHVMLRDLDGTIRLWTSGAAQVYGWNKAEAIGRISHDLLSTEFPVPLSGINRELGLSGHWEGTLRHRRRDGTVVVKHSQWFLHRDTSGVQSVLEINRDITEQRRAEELFRVAVEGSPTGLLMVDGRGLIVLVNHELERIFGYSRDELLGQRIDLLVPDSVRDGHPALRLEFLRDPRTRAMGAGRELFGRRKDGREVPVEIGLNPLPADAGMFVLASVVDITDRKRAEFELKRSNEELERFAYVASHDLQEPLRMVASYVQLLGKRYKGKLDADADEFIGYAADGATRMQRLIEDLLAFSRLGTRGGTSVPTDITGVVARAVANLTLAIAESGASVTAGELPTVPGDPGQLGHLFQNLISNAVKFRGEEPPAVHISAERHGDDWCFRVHDNGIGIEAEYYDRIFVIFQRLHGREKYGGTGIGLAIARKIVERHGGRIWVESTPGRGTTFLFTLPADKEHA
jgi:PAS domain S-box-containing protein